MKKYEVLLFDIDGTLFDFNKAESESIGKLMEYYKVPVTDENRMKYHLINQSWWERLERGEYSRDEILKKRFEEFFGGCGINVDGAEADSVYRSFLSEGSDFIEGVPEVLSYLKDSGKYKMYIVTNGVAKTQRRRIEKSGLDKWFDGIFVSEDTGSQKPQPEFFDYCFEKMGRDDRENMLIIGDSLTSDIRGGNNAGIDTLWYNPDGLSVSGNVHVDYEIRNIRELEDIL